MVGIVSSVCGEVEGYRETFLAGGEIATVEGVGLRSCGEACILADSPGAKGVHGTVRTTQEGRNTAHVVEVFESFEVGGGVDALHRNQFGGDPVGGITCGSRSGSAVPGSDIYIAEIGFHSCELCRFRRLIC